jgi:hypothetical protein
MVLYVESEGNRIVVHVDPGFPTAWRQEPYYSQLKDWARAAVDAGGQVVAYIRDRVIVILPNKEIDLGTFEPGDHIMVAELNVPYGRDWRAYKVASKDVPSDQRGKWVNIKQRKRGPTESRWPWT